jgi:flagellar biosynthesis/type III secretory pathway M-ring protein FliF/YscJ
MRIEKQTRITAERFTNRTPMMLVNLLVLAIVFAIVAAAHYRSEAETYRSLHAQEKARAERMLKALDEGQYAQPVRIIRVYNGGKGAA